jgi:hypothetical protein
MPSIGQTWVLASIGAVVEMGVLSRPTLKRLLMESIRNISITFLSKVSGQSHWYDSPFIVNCYHIPRSRVPHEHCLSEWFNCSCSPGWQNVTPQQVWITCLYPGPPCVLAMHVYTSQKLCHVWGHPVGGAHRGASDVTTLANGLWGMLLNRSLGLLCLEWD